MDLTEFKELLDKQGEAFEQFRARHDATVADLKAERKEREDLEARINRLHLSGTLGTHTKSIDSTESKAELAALSKFVRTGDESEIKSLSVGSDPDGGYTVFPVMSDRMTQ